MPDQTTSPDQDIEKILGRSLASKSDKPKEAKQQAVKPQIGPQQTPEDDIDKVIGRKVAPVPKKKSIFLSPEERTGTHMTAIPGSGGGSLFGDEGIGKAVGVASAIDKPIEEHIEKGTKYVANKIDQAADFLMSGERHSRDQLAANGYPTLAKLSAYSEAVNPINISRETYKVAAGMLTDPKNWPFILEGGGTVRPAIKTAGTALFTVMQQYGAIDALKNHDYSSAAMQEAFALLGMKDLPAGVREVIGKEAANQHLGKSDTGDNGMTAPPEPKKAETKFKNGSTQADIPEHSEAHQALESARGAIAEVDLAGKGKDIGGNHVTIRYGIKSDDVDGVRNFLRKQAPFEATLGKTEKFDPTEQSEGAAVVKAPIDSPEMHRINRELEKHGDFIDPTFDYKPHATVAYVKPEAADKYVGMDSTHGKKFMVDSITISGRDGSQEVVKLQGQAKDAVQAPTETPEGKPIPSGAQMMSPKKIEADPRRFQFRTEMSESGLGDVEHYNPDLGGVISVWKDPEDGKTYVVNGHHRLDLAKRAGADNVLVRYLDAPSAKEARAIGALQNIAEDKASPIDAAKFMRDAGKTPEDLKAMGFPLTGKAAKDGLALSKLSDPIFERVTMGEIPVGRAAVIGEELPDYADQTAVLQMIDSQGKKGVRLTDAEIREMARDAKADQKVSEKQVDLFGESTIEKSSSVEKAKLSVWLQKQLSRDKKLFGYVAKTERARELAKAGNIIDVDQSKAVAESSKITEEVYQRLVRAKGPIADALREGAGRWAAGDDEKTVKSETYQKVQTAVEQELKGGTYTPSPTDPIPGMGESRLREVLRSHPGMAGLADDLVDQAAILSQNAIGMPLDEFLRKNWSDVKVEGTPGKGALRQDESLWAWVKQSGSNLSIEPYGEQLSMFGDPEKTFMLRNKKGQEAMVLESQLNRLAEDFPALGKKIGFMQQTGKAVEFAPKGDAPAELPMEQGGLFGDIRRGVEDQEGSLFGPMEDDDPKLLFQDDNPVWYAKSQHILDDPKMPGSQTGHQWLSMLENKGVKADELKWMGIDDFLRDKKKVTKQELQDYIRENQVEVKEVVRPFDEKIDPDYVLESELRLSGPTIDSRVSIRETLDADGNRILTAKPNAVGEFSQDLIHRELLRWAVEHGYDKFDLEGKKRVDITDSMRKSVMEGQPLFQGKKGATEFLNDGKAMVYLFKNADPSTFLHEFIHTMEPYLKPEDRAVIDKWLDKEGIDKPVARKEALARAFEEFHTNGEAPTEAVKPIFQRIQEVMRKIYEAIKDSPLIKPSKEVENLFNRWYGGDPEKLTAEGEIEQLLGRPLETVDIQPTSMFFGEEGQKPLLDIDDKSDAAKQFTAPPESHGFELPPELETPGPGAKNVNTVRETPADILQLRDSLAAVTSPHQGMRERLGNADKLASKISRGKDSLSSSWDHVKTTFAAIWNAYRHPLPWTDFDDMFEKWGGANQMAEAQAQSFAREIKRKVPDPLRRQAMVNWIEAGGDKTTLLSQYVRSTAPEYKEAYSLATELNDTEETWARNVSNYMESRLQAAIDGGMLDHGVDNYINRILKKPEDSVAVQKLMGELSMGKLESNPRFTKKRIFETSFAAEQAGFKHVNKDAGFLVTAYDISFNRALAARSFVKSILSGHAPDGRPIVAVSGSGQVIDSESVGEKAYVIRPTTKDGDAAGYGTINHPALNKWIWIAQDGEGNPIYLKGNLVVHPDYIKKLTNTFSKSAFRVNPVGNFALKAYRFGKSSMFSLSPFHQVRVGSGVMLEYWLNPFNAPEIDFQQSKQRKLVEHSLQIVNNSALAEFSDGVSGSGILQAVPYLGKWSQQYAHYVFGDYLPRLKMKLALHLLDKNMEHYKGDLSDDQIYKLTADQANSTVGEQNYHSLARNPTFQDGMRLFLLAPDFLESEAKSFGGALKPYGREKAYALIRSGAVLYMGSRLMNMAANNGDPKWDKPFSIVINGHEYSARSEVGDVYHAATDLKSFVLWRLNPYTVKPFVEGVTGRDMYGHKQTFKDQAKKDVSQMLPIPSQEPFDAGINYLKQVAPNLPLSFFNTKPEASIWNGFLESLGIRQSTYRSPAADMAHKMELDSLPASVTKEKLEHSYKVKQLQKEYTEGTLSPMDLGKMVEDDKITDADEKRIMGKQSGYDELQRNLTHRSAEEAMKIWAIATPKERAEVRNELLTKIERSRTITPKQRDKFKEELMEGAFTAPPPEGFHWPLSQ